MFIPPGILMAKDNTPDRRIHTPDYFFYDDRFREARELASKLSAACKLTPVQGDMTGIWNAGIRHECRCSPVTMQGVTTESFYFCLQGMVDSVAKIESQVMRVNRDLFEWKIQSNNYLQAG